MDIVDSPGTIEQGKGFRVKEIYAWLTYDPDSKTEGICALFTGSQWLSAVCTTPKLAKAMKNDVLRAVYAKPNVKARLVKFRIEETIDSI